MSRHWLKRRWLGLYLRVRRVPAVAAVVVATSLVSWWAGSWLMERPFLSDDQARIPVSALGTLVVAGVLTATLGSPDEWLDRSTPAPWRRIRMVHLVVAAGLGAGCLGSTALTRPELYGAPVMARGVVGLLGLAAIAATAVGARTAWIPVLGYASTVYLAAPRTPGGLAAVWAWPMQPTPVTASFVTAGVVCVVGVAVHAARGARPTADPP